MSFDLANLCTLIADVHRDLQTYKTLMSVFPKGKFIPDNQVQRLFGHYLPQQAAACQILDLMERNKLLPDKELLDITVNAFGRWTKPHGKLMQQFYWSMKFRYSNPWDVPRHVPDDARELAMLAMRTM